jgi:2-polyprenyl-6-methoxyphenol hydroxylase-like FAD-dependent oxidoreductase
MNLDQGSFQNKLNNVIKNSNYYLRNKANYVEIPEIIEIVNKRLSFPLSTMQSSAYTQERIALVGDAAHTIHPMAGLGVNSGIMDSALLANNIIKNIKTGNDIGDPIALG